MFNKLKIKKYISNIQGVFMSDDFTDLFLDSNVLGYSDSEFDEKTYLKLSKLLENVYTKINTNSEFSELILDGSDYLVPYTLGWVKLHVREDNISGLTLYFNNKAYKLYCNSYNKSAYLNVLNISEPRNIKIIEQNLRVI